MDKSFKGAAHTDLRTEHESSADGAEAPHLRTVTCSRRVRGYVIPIIGQPPWKQSDEKEQGVMRKSCTELKKVQAGRMLVVSTR